MADIDFKSRRRIKNYLLNGPLQLKLTAYVLAGTLMLTAFLGAFLRHETNAVVHAAEQISDQRRKTAEAHKELAKATLASKISDIGTMDWDAAHAQLKEIETRYASELGESAAERATLVEHQRRVLWALLVGLAAFVVAIFLASIVITHRIAGPLFRFHRMADDVIGGGLRLPSYGLRKSDHLKDYFAKFTQMLEALRGREAAELAAWDEAIALAAKAHASPELMATFMSIRHAKRTRLELEPASGAPMGTLAELPRSPLQEGSMEVKRTSERGGQ